MVIEDKKLHVLVWGIMLYLSHSTIQKGTCMSLHQVVYNRVLKMRKRIVREITAMIMAATLLVGGVLTDSVAATVCAAETQPVKTTLAEPENLPLNTNVAGELVEDNAHYYSFTTDNKNVDYQFVLVNDTPITHPKFSIMHVEIVAAPFHANGQYEYQDYLFGRAWVKASINRTFRKTVSLKKNTKYIIQVAPFYYQTTPYHLAVYQLSKTPAIKKVTPKKKSIKVKFAKTALAKSYEVAVKKKGGSWKVYNTKKTTYTLKKLESKKKYSVRVRSMCKVKGAKKYSAWSKAKTVTVK